MTTVLTKQTLGEAFDVFSGSDWEKRYGNKNQYACEYLQTRSFAREPYYRIIKANIPGKIIAKRRIQPCDVLINPYFNTECKIVIAEDIFRGISIPLLAGVNCHVIRTFDFNQAVDVWEFLSSSEGQLKIANASTRLAFGISPKWRINIDALKGVEL